MNVRELNPTVRAVTMCPPNHTHYALLSFSPKTTKLGDTTVLLMEPEAGFSEKYYTMGMDFCVKVDGLPVSLTLDEIEERRQAAYITGSQHYIPRGGNSAVHRHLYVTFQLGED